VIKEVKQELRVLFLKRKDIIIKLGNEYEKLVVNPESVCEEIKLALHEEIVDLTISSRDIERYCPDKWKKKTKPQKNDKLSFLTKTEGQEKEEHMTIAIDTQGSPADELKLIGPKSQTCIKERNCDLETQELSTNIQSNTINVDSCPNCKKPLLENQRIHHEKDIKIKELEAERQQYGDDLKIARTERAGLLAQVEFLHKQLQLSNKQNNMNEYSSNDEVIDFEFRLSWETVREYMSSTFKSGKTLEVWFRGRVQKLTGKVIEAYPGKKSELKAFKHNQERSE
jgi:hypothetical protein